VVDKNPNKGKTYVLELEDTAMKGYGYPLVKLAEETNWFSLNPIGDLRESSRGTWGYKKTPICKKGLNRW